MNTGGDLYVGDFPDKGCFMKNGHGYFGTGGTDEEMAADLAGVRERIWCERETDPTTHPTRSPVIKSPTMIGIDIDSSSNELSAKPVTDESTGQSSAKPIELVTKSPSNQSTAKPVIDSTTTTSTTTPVTDAPSLQVTTKPSISTSFQTFVPTMSPSSIISTGPSQSTTKSTPTPVTDASSLQLTTKPSISTSFQTSMPMMSPSSIISTGPSQSTTTSTPSPVTDDPSLQLTTKPSISPSFQTSMPTMSPSSIISTGPSQSVLPLPITEHTIEMTSPNNDLKIPSFAPITTPSSISDNSTDIIDSQLSTHDDPIISNQLYLIGVVFVVGFLLVSMYAIKTRYGRKLAQSQMNSGDDLEEPAVDETDVPRYIDVKTNEDDPIEPLDSPHVLQDKAIEDTPLETLLGCFSYWSPSMLFPSNGGTTTSPAVSDENSTVASLKSTGGLSGTISLFASCQPDRDDSNTKP
ncbi:hypothetical protein ACHAW5_009872 [Stephanodiscus triporus]|uniref:Uncharacterized protein n=1 Tax=Stephanodiscus triporus TaxID=2934178 RepID=A0ABD3QIU8_9STRA